MCLCVWQIVLVLYQLVFYLLSQHDPISFLRCLVYLKASSSLQNSIDDHLLVTDGALQMWVENQVENQAVFSQLMSFWILVAAALLTKVLTLAWIANSLWHAPFLQPV